MARISAQDRRFGDVAIEMQLVSKEKIERALVVQDLIFTRTKVHMAIGKVLKEMGVLTQEQIDSVLENQTLMDAADQNGPDDVDCGCQAPDGGDVSDGDTVAFPLSLTLPKDKLSAFISPSGKQQNTRPTVEDLKDFLKGRSVVHGLEGDRVLEAYLAQDPLPMEPFKVATGTRPVPGKPPELIYHFDTDPLRIGTLKKDGTMDWKDRGDIPQVKEGDLLVEKTEGIPGKPGISVCGKELPPPRMRNPKLKSGKGAQRSKDGRHIVAKINGTPKRSSDGKIFVFSMLSIDGDIGVETGHVDYDGHIEVSGGVSSGYTVKGKGLRTAEIQDATIEVAEDLVCHGGIYGSKLKVGGNLKANHIHNCTIELIGDLVAKKEVYDSTIEANGRCLIVDGKVIDCKVDAKKGIYARDIGSEGSSPNKLWVGFDRIYEREMAEYKAEKKELEQQKALAESQHPEIETALERIANELGELAQEQDNYMLQKRQFEEQLRGEGPNPIDADDEEERMMLEEMISELVDKNSEMDARVRELMAEDDKLTLQKIETEKKIPMINQHIENLKEKIEMLEASLKVNPGIAEVKTNGTIYNKTEIVGPHKEYIVPQDMQRVRIAESKVDPDTNRYQMKISNI